MDEAEDMDEELDLEEILAELRTRGRRTRRSHRQH